MVELNIQRYQEVDFIDPSPLNNGNNYQDDICILTDRFPDVLPRNNYTYNMNAFVAIRTELNNGSESSEKLTKFLRSSMLLQMLNLVGSNLKIERISILRSKP